MAKSALPSGQGCDRRLDARDVADVVGTEHVEVAVEAALQLVVVVGDVAGEIGVAAVRFHQRAIDVVAEGGRAEQRLLAVLPLLVVVALGRRAAGPRR